MNEAARSFLLDTEINRLRWRCRRGLLENDLLIEQFFNRYSAQLLPENAQALMDLMDLSDNDLLDLLLARKMLADVAPELDQPVVHATIAMIKPQS